MHVLHDRLIRMSTPPHAAVRSYTATCRGVDGTPGQQTHTNCFERETNAAHCPTHQHSTAQHDTPGTTARTCDRVRSAPAPT